MNNVTRFFEKFDCSVNITELNSFKLLKIKHDTSKGFALGLISHGIGTARAVEMGEKTAAFAALAMGLSGIFTAIFLPIVIGILK